MAYYSEVNLDSKELCLIDSGVTSLLDVPLRNHLHSLNLHSNYINRIEGLHQLHFLKHLDLSANQIRTIEGLDRLACLKTLNISCNMLKSVDGLHALRSLEKLNVSYNQIDDLSGLKSMSGSMYKLSYIDLHGNKLSSIAHISQCLIRLESLRHLILSLDGSGNAVCHKQEYPSQLFSSLSQLQYIDDHDRLGNTIQEKETNIPGIDDYLDYLLSNEEDHNTLQESSKSDVITPKIDQAMELFRKRQSSRDANYPQSSTDDSIIQSVTDTEVSPSSRKNVSRFKAVKEPSVLKEQDFRLENLEKQIAELISRTKAVPASSGSETIGKESGQSSQDSSQQRPERDLDTCGSDSEPQREHKRKPSRSKLPSYRKSTAASRARKEAKTSKEQTDEDARPKSPFVQGSEITPSARVETDDQIRNDIHSSYTDIIKEVERERERRWKAEAAVKRLVDHIQGLSSKAKDDNDMKDLAIDATSRLKQALMNEREAKLRALDENEKLEKQLQEAVEHLSRSKAIEAEQSKTLREMEEMSVKDEREKLKQQTHDHKKLQEAQMKAAALSREVDMLRGTLENQKGQIQSLQSLLANREQEHREELKSRYSLGSKEMQSAIQEEVKRLEKEHTQQMKQQQEKIEELSKQYSGLEDEFRQALQIESSRFQQLKDAFEEVSEENAGNKAALLAAQKKDTDTSSMIQELTALVKEQKGRISELSKSKQEQTSHYRERVNTLEAHVEEARKRMVQLEILKQVVLSENLTTVQLLYSFEEISSNILSSVIKQLEKDNIKLKSQVHGQESVIEGLRAERRLWEQELAHQGASLAQDRGSLEAKLEAQKSEIAILKKHLERETDGLKIKTKMLEDQTETIKKLKEGVEERDEEIKKCRQENLKIQQNLEDQLSEERANSQDNQELLERLRERKQDLKQQVSELQQELDESKKAHGVLNSRWKEKSQLIGQLEGQVREMKESWEKKEVKLTQERDKALGAANLAIDRLKSADDAFRKQLEDKIQAYQSQMAQVEEEKEEELQKANLRIFEVEEEMRELLKENKAAKRAMEDKVKRLTQAMTDLQTDLY